MTYFGKLLRNAKLVGLEMVVLMNKINTDNISELRELRSVGTPILVGVSPTKQMSEALVE